MKKEIREIIKNVPEGYYLESIEVRNIHGENVITGSYKPEYELHCEEFQWIAPGGNSYNRPTSLQFEAVIREEQNKKSRIEIVEFIKEKTKAYSNEENSTSNDNEYSSGTVNIENGYNELLTVVYKTYKH